MCGICGFVDYKNTVRDPETVLRRMNDSLRHRGPDDRGEADLAPAWLAMTRLSIIDIAGGHQPMADPENINTIVYNGEIYNFKKLRRKMERGGAVFQTRSDTEILLTSLAARGADALADMNGMFAFAIWNAQERRLLAARDRLGIKPFFYIHRDGFFAWASEIKALLPLADTRELDPEALDDYLTHLYIPGEKTIFRGVRRLPPGCLLTFDESGLDIRRWWSLPEPRPLLKGDTDNVVAAELRTRLLESTRAMLVSDVPVGVFLSGGLDSSAIAALMAQASDTRIRTFSVGFSETSYSEMPYARQVAKHIGSDHAELTVSLPDLREFLPVLARAFDEPFADAAAIPTWLITREAAKHVKVILSGAGGDELFAGYAKYLNEPLMRAVRLAPAAARRAALALAESSLREGVGLGDRNRRVKRMLRYSLLPASSRPVSWINGFDADAKQQLLSPGLREQIGGRDALSPFVELFQSAKGAVLDRQLRVELETYLPSNNLHKDDICGMAHGLEIRVPFLDHTFASFATRLPPRMKLRGMKTKYILRRSVRDDLPEEIIDRPKQGFSAPIGPWLRGELAGYTRERLVDSPGPMSDFFRVPDIARILDLHTSGREDHSHRLWALLIFRAWHDEFLG